MKTYDTIVVLGSQPHYETWEFPPYAYTSLEKAEELRRQRIASYVSLSGDHALKYDDEGIVQPFKESDKQEEYLVEQLGTPKDCILKEGVSRDTLSNFYYLKNLVFKPHGFKNLLFVTTDFRIPRLRLIGQKVLGGEYDLDFVTVPYDQINAYKNEELTLRMQEEFLAPMEDGDDAWLEDKFYNAPYYRYWQEKSKAEADPEKRLII